MIGVSYESRSFLNADNPAKAQPVLVMISSVMMPGRRLGREGGYQQIPERHKHDQRHSAVVSGLPFVPFSSLSASLQILVQPRRMTITAWGWWRHLQMIEREEVERVDGLIRFGELKVPLVKLSLSVGRSSKRALPLFFAFTRSHLFLPVYPLLQTFIFPRPKLLNYSLRNSPGDLTLALPPPSNLSE